jgi:cyclopropane-fatty-acyl-phospholipid synthase
VAYLACVSLAFSRGTLRIFQTLVSKNAKRPPAIPPTRADLYR